MISKKVGIVESIKSSDDNLEDIKSYILGMKTENDMPRKR